MKLIRDLYCYVWQGADNNCNSYLLRSKLGGNKHVLIDPGHVVTPYYKEPGLNKLLEKIKEDGLVLEDIGLVIITHAHFDHCEAANVIRERYGALVALHKADEETYRRFGGQVDVYLAEGELYVTGRKKDLIIVGGKNIYPQDLETVASEVEGIHPGRVAAFGIHNPRTGTEDAVIVAEIDEFSAEQPQENSHSIIGAIRQNVTRKSDIALRYVQLVERNWLIKTSSGKVSREANRQKYLREFGSSI